MEDLRGRDIKKQNVDSKAIRNGKGWTEYVIVDGEKEKYLENLIGRRIEHSQESHKKWVVKIEAVTEF